MIRKKHVYRHLFLRIGGVAAALGLAHWLASSPIMADSTVSAAGTTVNLGLTILYIGAVIGTLFVLSSMSTLSLILSEEAHKGSRTGQR